jgi:hypothetical protein
MLDRMINPFLPVRLAIAPHALAARETVAAKLKEKEHLQSILENVRSTFRGAGITFIQAPVLRPRCYLTFVLEVHFGWWQSSNFPSAVCTRYICYAHSFCRPQVSKEQ